jgi:hypothetical protein
MPKLDFWQAHLRPLQDHAEAELVERAQEFLVRD